MAISGKTPDLNKLNAALGDITNKLDKMSRGDFSWPGYKENIQNSKDLQSALDGIIAQQKHLQQVSAATGQDFSNDLDILKKKAGEVDKAMKSLGSTTQNFSKMLTGQLVKGMEKVGDSIIGMGLNVFTVGINSLAKGIEKVHDLFERWAKVMGEFNLKVGAASSNMKTANKMAAQWDGAMRGLGLSMGQGSQMLGDFLENFDHMPFEIKSKEMGRFSKNMMGLARGLNLGGDGAGQFADMLSRIHLEKPMASLKDNPEEAAKAMKDLNDKTGETFKEIVAGAKAAGVPVNKFAKEFVQAKDWVAEFGASSDKVLIRSIAFAKSYGVSLKSLKKFTDFTDTFDNAAQSAAKLNTVFGTTINAMDMMLEQDPGKRFEMVRKQLIDQGKTFDNVSRMEKKILAETMQMSIEEITSMLKSGKSLEEFEKDQEKAKEKKLKSETMIRDAMAKTAVTLHNFGVSWDKVTMAIVGLIKPFTDMLGLTKSGEKGAKSFSGVMTQLFDRLIKFINEVAANKDWQGFMQKLAKDAGDFAKKVSAIATGPELGKWISTAVKAGQDFYDIMKKAFNWIVDGGKSAMPVIEFLAKHLKTIVALWAGAKIAGAGMGMMQAGGGMAAGGMGAMGKGMGALGAGAMGGAAGFGGAKLLGASDNVSAGAGIGGAIGGLIGSFAGSPVIGSAIGIAFGTLIGKLLDSPEQQKIIKAMKTAQERNSIQNLELDVKKREIGTVINDLYEKQSKTGADVVDVTEKQKAKLLEQIDTLKKLGEKGTDFDTILKELSTGSGEIAKKSLDQLKIALNETYDKLKALNSAYDQQIEHEKKINEIQARKNKLENDALTEKLSKGAANVLNRTPIDAIKDLFASAQAKKARKDEEDQMKDLLKKKEESQKKQESMQIEHNKKINALEIAKLVETSEEFRQFAAKPENAGMSFEALLAKKIQENPSFMGGIIGKNDIDSISSAKGKVRKNAMGGITSGAQVGMIGENGPEAIVPLKALAGNSSSPESNAIGAKAAENIVNYASRNSDAGGGGSNTAQIVAGDVYIDGVIMGRHIARQLLTQYE